MIVVDAEPEQPDQRLLPLAGGSACRNSAKSPCGSTTHVAEVARTAARAAPRRPWSAGGAPSATGSVSSSTAAGARRGRAGAPAGPCAPTRRRSRPAAARGRRRTARCSPPDVEHETDRAPRRVGRQRQRRPCAASSQRGTEPYSANVIASITVDLPEPVGPTSAKYSASGEVDGRWLAEGRAKPSISQQHRAHQRSPGDLARAGGRTARSTRGSATPPASPRYSREQLGRAAASRLRRRAAWRRRVRRTPGRCAPPARCGSKAVTSSRSPARAGSRTQTRRKSSPTIVAEHRQLGDRAAHRAQPAPGRDRDVGDPRRACRARRRRRRPPACSPARRSRPPAARRCSAPGTRPPRVCRRCRWPSAT